MTPAKETCDCRVCRCLAWIGKHLRRPAERLARRVVHSQPVPIGVFVAHIPGKHGANWTAITRVWDAGDEEHCRLCPVDRCAVSPSHGVCLVVIPRFIPDEECALHAWGSPEQRGLA